MVANYCLLTIYIVFKLFIAIFISVLVIASLSGQSNKPYLLASGGIFQKNTIVSLSYSIGEPAIRTIKTSNNIFTEGFQQSFSIITFLEIRNAIRVFPNPVTDYLNVSFYIEDTNSYIVGIYTITGQIIDIQQYNNLTASTVKQYDFTNRSGGLYLVKVQSLDGRYFKTFKIKKE